jgi:putative endonuclease
MTNKRNSVLYTGVTNDLGRRVFEHKTGVGSIFTKRYNISRLVYYESTHDVRGAIDREKQIKSWPRRRKEALIQSINPSFRDLSDDL